MHDDFFLAEKYPAITFALDKLLAAGEGVTASGTLTVRGRSQPLSFPATVTLAGDGAVVLDATVEADRSQFGLTVNPMGMPSLTSTVTIHAGFPRS